MRIWIRTKAIRAFCRNKKCIYFIATPCHGNLGDHAIVYAQHQLMREMKIGENVVEISRGEYERLKSRLQNFIKKEDLIIIDGGGNLGTLWIEEENKMRDIVQRFPHNPIFIFPQTAYYEESQWGKEELEQSTAIYNEHSKLVIFCRDFVTYRLVSTRFAGVAAFYTPDMVPFLKNVQKKRKRRGILFCLRRDLEAACPEELANILKSYFVKRGYETRNTSTVIANGVSKRTRKRKLQIKWKELSAAELVITDRLHGMIFCAITGTPCVALDNISHKVREGYEWIKYLPYISFCDNYGNELLYKINTRLEDREDFSFDREPLEPYYNQIKKEVKKAFN